MLCVGDLLEYEGRHSAVFDGRVVYLTWWYALTRYYRAIMFTALKANSWLAPSSGESEYFAGRLAKFSFSVFGWRRMARHSEKVSISIKGMFSTLRMKLLDHRNMP
jgi:hypothetical protein